MKRIIWVLFIITTCLSLSGCANTTTSGQCSISGCSNPVYKDGLCPDHYVAVLTGSVSSDEKEDAEANIEDRAESKSEEKEEIDKSEDKNKLVDLSEEDKQTIINNAEYIVCQDLIDPSSASWNSAEIVEEDDYGRFLVLLDVTMTTSEGGRSRKQYYVIFRDVGDGGKFEYKKYGLAKSYTDDLSLQSLKSRNDWGVDPDAPEQDENASEAEDNGLDDDILFDETGDLSPAIFEELSGHYDDGNENTVDITSPDSMVRFIKGGNESHTYNEKICGYKVIRNNGYILKVEWKGDKYTYLYEKEGNKECLYLGTDEGWDPSVEPYNHVDGVQEYVKGTDAKTESKEDEDWDLDGAHEGSLPKNIFEKIKGTYYSEINGLEINISSPAKAIIKNGSYRQSETIMGCDADDKELFIYITDEGEEGIILSVYKSNGKMCMSTLEGGGWNNNKAHVHATLERVSDKVDSSKVEDRGYIIPDSADRLLTEADLRGLSKDDLRKARNEIAARHGRRFKDADLQAYFDAQSWYRGDIDPDDFNKIVRLSDIEQKNMEFIQKYEK